MKYKLLEIQNFGTIGFVSLNLSSRGLVLISGLNKDTPKADSNGAGKSLLLEAFCWCLWGRTIRDTADDDVVNPKIGKNCKVSLTFEEKNKKFTVVRYRKHEDSNKPNDVELFLNDVDISSTSMKMTQEVINSVVGLTFDTFCALMPGAGKNAAQMTDSDIKELLENMLQITALARARVETDKRLKSLKIKLEKNSQEIITLEEKIERDKARLHEYNIEERLFSEKLEEKVNRVEASKADLDIKRISNQRLVELGINADRESIRIKSELLEVQTAIQNNKFLITTIEANYTERYHNLCNERAKLEGELRVRQESLDKISNIENSCTYCQQDVSPMHVHQVKEEVRRICDSLENRISEYDKFFSDLEVEKVRVLSTPKKQLLQHETLVVLLISSLENFEPVIKEAAEASTRLSELENAEVRLDQQIVEIRAEKSPYTVWIAQISKQLKDSQESLDLKLKEQEELVLSEHQLQFWKDAFAPSGIRSFILDNVTPILNERVKHYCDLLTDGEMSVDFSTKTVLKSGEVREKFSINIKQKHGGSNYKSNSTGERQRANLAVAFSLSDLAELHSNKSIDFRFLDEPFEGVDESGIDAVISLLHEQQNKHPTVFVVTHQSYFKDVFPTEIVMVKQDGISHLEG